jgi:hypothetical protein
MSVIIPPLPKWITDLPCDARPVNEQDLIFGEVYLVWHNNQHVKMAYQGRGVGGTFRFVAGKKNTRGRVYYCLHCGWTVKLDNLKMVWKNEKETQASGQDEAE